VTTRGIDHSTVGDHRGSPPAGPEDSSPDPMSETGDRLGWAGVGLVLIGAISSGTGYWLGPELLCPDPTAGASGQYCALGWWLVVSPLVVLVGGAIAGGLLGPSRGRWLASLAGLAVGNVVGSLAALAIAHSNRRHDPIFGDPPRFEDPIVLLLGFTVVGVIAFTVGWVIGSGVQLLTRRLIGKR
jgi:hypothetical protein